MTFDLPRIERAAYALYSEKCPTCGHEKVAQWHKLSEAHVRGLIKCAEAEQAFGRPVTRHEAGIDQDGSEYGNFAAMRWWGLIQDCLHDRWSVTPLGWDFLAFRRSVPLHVLTVDGEAKAYSIGLCDLTQVSRSEVWRKADFLNHRVPLIDSQALVA